MYSMTHWILDKAEEKMDDLEWGRDKKHPNAKAFAIGMLEALIDGAVICGICCIGAGLVERFKNTTK